MRSAALAITRHATAAMPAIGDKDAPRSARGYRFVLGGSMGRATGSAARRRSNLVDTSRAAARFAPIRANRNRDTSLEQMPKPVRLDADRGTGLCVEAGRAPERGSCNREALEPVSTPVQCFFDDEFEEIRRICIFLKLGAAQSLPTRLQLRGDRSWRYPENNSPSTEPLCIEASEEIHRASLIQGVIHLNNYYKMVFSALWR